MNNFQTSRQFSELSNEFVDRHSPLENQHKKPPSNLPMPPSTLPMQNNNRSSMNYNVQQLGTYQNQPTMSSNFAGSSGMNYGTNNYSHVYNQHCNQYVEPGPSDMPTVNGERCAYCPQLFDRKSTNYTYHLTHYHRHVFETCQMTPGHDASSKKPQRYCCPGCFQMKKDVDDMKKCQTFHKENEVNEDQEAATTSIDGEAPSPKPRLFVCPEEGCPRTYKIRKTLIDHCRKQHSYIFKVEKQPPWSWQCKYCLRRLVTERSKITHEKICRVRPENLEATKKKEKARVRKKTTTNPKKAKGGPPTLKKKSGSPTGILGAPNNLGPPPHQTLDEPPQQTFGAPSNLGPPPHQSSGAHQLQALGAPSNVGPPQNQSLGPPPHHAFRPPHHAFSPPPTQTMSAPPLQTMSPPSHNALGAPPYLSSSAPNAPIHHKSNDFINSILDGRDYQYELGENVGKMFSNNQEDLSLSKSHSLRSHSSINSSEGLIGSQ